ncbi:hypothetical protein F511_23444 [Dorcoceras hygrometricum]|uniref:Uncharacterized protein n=1 Tax=Dorcoceras hygrometricum TaxID=472368 RepID=A0A2Z7CRD1_9LAMI|nr:hypothetical protein F511_23444 [Dorcoceras hygrometricum]
MLRLVSAGGIACEFLLVVQQKQMSTRVNIPVARRGNIVVSLLRLRVQLRVIFSAVACCWYFGRASDWMTNFQPFVPYPSNPRALFSRELFRRIPVVSGGCFAGARLLPESSGFLAVLIVAQYKVFMLVFQHVAYTHGRATIPHSHLPAGIVATMRRVVNYHSSWARQQQVELFDASGNPGSIAGRGFNPAGGAPGGG